MKGFIFSHGPYRGTMLNLTPHNVNLYGKKGENPLYTIPSCGTIRLDRSETNQYNECAISSDASVLQFNFATYSPFIGHTREMKDDETPIVNQCLIVSMPVADYLLKNNLYPKCAVVIPDTGPASVVRDEKGVILGVTSFIVYRIPQY